MTPRTAVGRRGDERAGRRGDEGAGSIVVLGVVAVIFAVTMAVLPVAGVLSARHQAAGAADAAALAAADVAVGLRAGSPCSLAAEVAEVNGAETVACVVDGAVVTVRVSARAGVVTVTATATAGPPTAGFGLVDG